MLVLKSQEFATFYQYLCTYIMWFYNADFTILFLKYLMKCNIIYYLERIIYIYAKHCKYMIYLCDE